MKSVYAAFFVLMFGSSSAMALASKTYAGQDDHGQPCDLMMMFENGKVVSIVVKALADVSKSKKPEPVFEMMMPEQFDKLIKQTGNLERKKFYFQALEDKSEQGITLKRDMGLAIDLRRGVMNYEKHSQVAGSKASSLMSCVGLKETKHEVPPGMEDDNCDFISSPDMRNMCKVEAGKKSGKIPPGAVASPTGPGPSQSGK